MPWRLYLGRLYVLKFLAYLATNEGHFSPASNHAGRSEGAQWPFHLLPNLLFLLNPILIFFKQFLIIISFDFDGLVLTKDLKSFSVLVCYYLRDWFLFVWLHSRFLLVRHNRL